MSKRHFLILAVSATSALSVLSLGSELLLSPPDPNLRASISSSFEGPLSAKHDSELAQARARFFYDQNGTLNPSKVHAFIAFLVQKREEARESVRMSKKEWLITQRGFSDEKAQKQAQDDVNASSTELLAPFELAIEGAQALLAELEKLDPLAIRDRVEDLLLFYASAHTINQSHIYTDTVRLLENAYHNFYGLKIDDSRELQASNLIHDGRFRTQAELQDLKAQGGDLSRLDPPSSAFWNDNRIEEFDPTDETFMGETIVPPKTPEFGEVPTFHYKRMGRGQIKIKVDWYDVTQRTRTGKPKKKGATLRMGPEVHTSIITSQLARAVGYPAIPTVHRRRVRLELGDASYDSFVSAWKIAHSDSLGSAATYVERIPGENALYLNNVAIEAYPDKKKYREMGPFRMGRNGFTNRREYRALLIYAGLIALRDTGDDQVRADAYQDPLTGRWKPLFFLSDTGYSLGSIFIVKNPGTVNSFPNLFTTRLESTGLDDKVVVWWQHKGFHPKTFLATTYSDAKWLVRRFARLSDTQLRKIIEASGAPAPVVELYLNKIKARINKLLEDFDLEKEGFRPYTIKSDEELNAQFPRYINEQGYLTFEADGIEGNNLPILGYRPTLFQRGIMQGITFLQDRLHSMLELKPDPLKVGEILDLGEWSTDVGLKVGGKREISVNHEHGPGQKRFLVKDSFTVSVPVGTMGENLQAPVSLYYVYTYTYYHSYATLIDVSYKGFLNTVIPTSIFSIKANLQTGDALHIRHAFGINLGHGKLAASDSLEVYFGLLGISNEVISELYVTKTSRELIEMVRASSVRNTLSTGAELVAYLKLAAGASLEKTKRDYSLYRFDTLNLGKDDSAKLQQAFEKALLHNDFALADEVARKHRVSEDWLAKNSSFGALLWTWNRHTGSRTLEVHSTPGRLDTVFTTQYVRGFDRSVGNAWSTKLSAKIEEKLASAKSATNFLTEFLNESQNTILKLETVATEDYTDLREADLTLDLLQSDNWCTRDEFHREFLPYFNSRSGSGSYITFRMPEDVKYYSPLLGQMHWQIKMPGLKDLISALKRPEELERLAPKHPVPGASRSGDSDAGYMQHQPPQPEDPRDTARRLITEIEKPVSATLPQQERRERLRAKTDAILELVKLVIQKDASRASLLRQWIPDEKLWIYTKITNPLEYSNPTLLARKNSYFFAPEIGRFQGASYIDRIRFVELLVPHWYYGSTAPAGFAP